VEQLLLDMAYQFQGHWSLPAGELQRHHIWLGIPPQGIHQGVWDVVCLAALNAMDAARRTMIRSQLSTISVTLPTRQLARVGARAAVVAYWKLLANFVGVGALPAAWEHQLLAKPDHPFLTWCEAERGLRLHRRPRLL
jgi:hypothetical protein